MICFTIGYIKVFRKLYIYKIKDKIIKINITKNKSFVNIDV